MAVSKKNDFQDKKNRWDLLPLGTVDEVVKVFTFGAQKYGENTWQKLPNGIQRYKGALIRHLVAFDKGELCDPESGLHPLAHAAWNAIAMLHLALDKEADANHMQKMLLLDKSTLFLIRDSMANCYFNATTIEHKEHLLYLINKVQKELGCDEFKSLNEFEHSTANQWIEK